MIEVLIVEDRNTSLDNKNSNSSNNNDNNNNNNNSNNSNNNNDNDNDNDNETMCCGISKSKGGQCVKSTLYHFAVADHNCTSQFMGEKATKTRWYSSTYVVVRSISIE